MTPLSCPSCEGSGHVAGPTLVPQSHYAPAEVATRRCHGCGGSGVRKCAACAIAPATALLEDVPVCAACLAEYGRVVRCERDTMPAPPPVYQ